MITVIENNIERYATYKNPNPLTVYTLNDSQNKELEYLLSVIVPLNIITNIVYENALEGNVRFGGVLQESNIITIRQV